VTRFVRTLRFWRNSSCPHCTGLNDWLDWPTYQRQESKPRRATAMWWGPAEKGCRWEGGQKLKKVI